MSNLKIDFIEHLGNDLINVVGDKDLFNSIMDIITINLDKYELSEQCTELVVSESSNELILKRYCACLLIDGKSKNTIYQYARELKRFYLFTGKNFADIDTYDIRMYLAVYKQKGLCSRSLSSIRSYIYTFFEWLVGEEIIDKNPCSKIKPIKYNRNTKKPFTDVEIDAIRAGCKTLRERALVELLLSSGVRRAELCDLEINDINFTDLSVLVRNGKGGKERITYINDVSATYLKKYLAEREPYSGNEKLFRTKQGYLKYTGLRYVLNQIGERSGVEDVHPHRFRRTFATTLANRGMDIQEIQQLLGHATINVTMQYVCIDDTRIKTSYKKYSQNI